MSLSIIVLNYRTPELVIKCLESLSHERNLVEFDAIVVDNCSGDGSATTIRSFVESRSWREWIKVIESPSNGGFSAGNNIGVESTKSSLYLLLNSDTYVRKGAISALVESAANLPDAGLIGPQLEWPDEQVQTSSFRWPKPSSELVRSANTGPLSRILHSSVVAIDPRELTQDPEWISFAAVLIRSEVIKDIGPLDEGFFMYFEDIDYCRRAAEAGWKIAYEPNARVVHTRGGTSTVKQSEKTKARRPNYYYQSRSRYFAKYYGRRGLWRANLYWILGRCISLLREVIERNSRWSCHQEWRDNWTNALDPLAGRSTRG